MFFRKLQPFDYQEPDSLSEALQILSSSSGKAAILAGGVSLIDEMKRGMRKPDVMLSLHRIQELRFLDTFDGALGIGALTTLKEGEGASLIRDRYGCLWDAIAQIGSVQVKTMGTIVGNVAACNPASDVATALVALGAQVKITGPQRERTLPLESLGVNARKSSLEPDEIVTEIIIPAPPDGSVGAFLNLARTKEDIAKVAVCVHTVMEGGIIKDARIALGAVSPVILRSVEAENMLKGERPSLTLVETVAQAAAEGEGVNPITDLRSTAEYRRQMISVLTQRALAKSLNVYLN